MSANPHGALVERLGNLFADTFHVEAPAPDTDLLDSGALDSLQFVELLTQLERQFGLQIRIDDIDLDDLRTLEHLARLIAKNGSKAPLGPG